MSKWIICPTCSGEGQHSRAIGCITADQWEQDWSDDEKEMYLEGGYDQTCESCQGSGKIKEEQLRGLAEDRAERRLAAMEAGDSEGYYS